MHKIIYKVEYGIVSSSYTSIDEKVLHEKYEDEVFRDFHTVTNIIEETIGDKYIVTVIFNDGREEMITNILRVLKMTKNEQEEKGV